ncbi:MAG: MBL fold metallo-hydrolase [Actinobacteria bacterium]|nr:MBL fold metallo-hydrolase [Acidimicrobiia bacterium]MCA1736350.1 MBL fold metallo-hydrolase [Actinomycetota bacterium]
MTENWTEFGDRIFVRRFSSPFDLNVGLVVGGAGALVVDTRTNPAEARALRKEIRKVTALPVGWVFNTHEHWDHTFGNQEFSTARIWAHVACRERMEEDGEQARKRVIGYYPDDPAYQEVIITPPAETFADTASLDLGDRTVDFAFYGLGHTTNDAVLHVEGVTFAGDLVEDGNAPSFDDSYPVAWVETIGRLAEAARPIVIPGHGGPVDPDYLVMSRFDLAWIVRTARAGIERGTAVEDLALDGAPYPEEPVRLALSRAYAELEPRTLGS